VSARLLEVAGLAVELPGPPPIRPVQEVDLYLDVGETLCIVGESGCGKSLTSLALMGLLPQSMRRHARLLRFLGEDLLAADAGRLSDLRGDRLAMIFQDPMTALNPVLTIGEQLDEVWQRHRPAERAAGPGRALALLDRVGVPAAAARLRQYPHQLSGGLRQRVMIAMALMCDPALLIADEPTTALDVTIQAQTLQVLARLQHEFGAGMILVTHDLGVVARIADRVAVMYAGQVVESARNADLFANPRHPYTQGLLRAIAVPGRQKPRERLPTIPGTVPPPTDEVRACLFAERCPQVRAECLAAPVMLREIAADHAVRCVLA
jgi:peptide/nickel transport system ATP-binding protein